MDKSNIQTILFHFFVVYGVLESFSKMYFSNRNELTQEKEEEIFWERHPFEDPLEKAGYLCEIGYTFQKNEIIYKKISEKKWFAEILIPDDDQLEIGHEFEIENYIYTKIGEKAWTIERCD